MKQHTKTKQKVTRALAIGILHPVRRGWKKRETDRQTRDIRFNQSTPVTERDRGVGGGGGGEADRQETDRFNQSTPVTERDKGGGGGGRQTDKRQTDSINLLQ